MIAEERLHPFMADKEIEEHNKNYPNPNIGAAGNSH